MLLITVAAIAFPFSRPPAFRWRPHISRTASPSTIRPAASTKIARSPSPSNATPIRQPRSRTVRASCSGWVEPQSRLMLRPSGAALSTTTSNPSSLEQLRRHGCRRAVRGVDRDLERAEPLRVGERQPGSARCTHRSRRCCRPGTSADPVTCQLWSWMIASTSRSSALGELLALAREHLDAVVLERIVRRGNDEPGVEPHRPGHVGDRRRRDRRRRS